MCECKCPQMSDGVVRTTVEEGTSSWSCLRCMLGTEPESSKEQQVLLPCHCPSSPQHCFFYHFEARLASISLVGKGNLKRSSSNGHHLNSEITGIHHHGRS